MKFSVCMIVKVSCLYHSFLLFEVLHKNIDIVVVIEEPFEFVKKTVRSFKRRKQWTYVDAFPTDSEETKEGVVKWYWNENSFFKM